MKTFSFAAASLALVSSVAAGSSFTDKRAADAAQVLAPRASSTTLTAVATKGNAFFAGSTRFYIRGIDYQPGGSSNLVDPIANTATCTRDIAEFQKLGINTVRVYTVDNSANHDACMAALAAAGIYLVLDVNSPLYSINRATPQLSYNSAYLQNVFATIDAFAGYSNTLAFFSGNEVINDDTTTDTAPYVKATTRDMRSYIKARGYRSIPVGYSAADVSENRMQMAAYMNCGTDDERSDFFAFNDYSWCDPSSFTQSGWDQKVANFTGYSIPIFLSEYGCITNTRTFAETGALYNAEMTAVYSGGLVYEYSEEGSGYGLVTIASATSIVEKADFAALQTALKNNPTPTGDGGYSPSGTAMACPAQGPHWNVSSDALPAIPANAALYMKNGAGTGVGLSGPGSQNAVDSGTSTTTATPGSGSVTAVATNSAASATSSTKSAAGLSAAPFDSTFAMGMIVLTSIALGAGVVML